MTTIPAPGRPRPLRLPTVGDTTLPSGLRVLVVRRPGVPLVELRLRLPFAAPPGRRGDAFVARSQLLADSMLLGTDRRDASRLAEDLQALGGQLQVSADADRLGFAGSVLSADLPAYLALLAEVLCSASYPKAEVHGERDRLLQELAIHRSQPGVIAREALLSRMYGRHPYGRDLPGEEEVAAVRASQLRALHSRRVGPQGAVLTLVGDVSPGRALSAVAAALAGWTPTPDLLSLPPLPDPPAGSPLLVDRPGAVQTTIRMSRPAPDRSAPGYAALSLANLVFGGYFSSRWVANIREDKGYTYGPHSGLEHPVAGSRLTLSVDVATPVTAPSVVETTYELGRIATLPVGAEELDRARRYALGSLALGASSQAGLASTLSQLAGAGLDLDWLASHHRALGTVTVDDVLEVSSRYFAPTGFTSVLVGDAAVVGGPLRTLVDLDVP